jgi:hypothetical protein
LGSGAVDNLTQTIVHKNQAILKDHAGWRTYTTTFQVMVSALTMLKQPIASTCAAGIDAENNQS